MIYTIDIGSIACEIKEGSLLELVGSNIGAPLGQLLLQLLIDLVHVNISHDPMFSLHLLAMNSKSKILCHDAIFVNDLDASGLEIIAEIAKGIVLVELGTMKETACPCKDGCDGVCRGLISLLPLTVMPRDGT